MSASALHGYPVVSQILVRHLPRRNPPDTCRPILPPAGHSRPSPRRGCTHPCPGSV